MPLLRQRGLAALLGLAACLAAAPPAKAEAWKDSAEFGLVATGGNSETSTLGFKNTLTRVWARASFELKAGGVRAESTITSRRAVGDPANYAVVEQSRTDLTAENYHLNGRFDRTMSERVLWFTSAGWDRNRFAGVDSRLSAAAGIGNLWVGSDRVTFRTDYSLTFTRQEDVVAAAGADDTFLGARLTAKWNVKVGDHATFSNDLAVDQNLDESTDLRADMINSLAVSMSARLALKVSVQLLYDHEPALQAVDLFDPLDPVTPIGSVLVPLDDLDTIVTASVVVSF